MEYVILIVALVVLAVVVGGVLLLRRPGGRGTVAPPPPAATAAPEEEESGGAVATAPVGQAPAAPEIEQPPPTAGRLVRLRARLARSQSGFGTLDTVVVLVDGAPAEVPASALEPEMRDHFEKLYDGFWHQLLGVVDYRARLLRGRQSADAFTQAQQARGRLRKKVPEQKEQLGLAMFEADRVGTVAKAVAATPSSTTPTTSAALSTPDPDQ